MFGIQSQCNLTGFTIDAKSKQAHVQAIDGADAGQVTDFMMLAGLEGSYQERDNIA